MSTGRTLRTESTSSDATLEFAERIGRNMWGGEVIELIGDLGSGKTTFVRGLAAGLGSRSVVRSPSFTIGNEYRGTRLTLYHFDFYRLSEPGIMRQELAEAFGDSHAAVAVEWADIVADVLPVRRLTVHLRATAEQRRELRCIYPADLAYLMGGKEA